MCQEQTPTPNASWPPTTTASGAWWTKYLRGVNPFACVASAGVLAYVLALGERVFEGGRLLDAPFADLSAVGEQRNSSALAHASAVVFGVHGQRDLADWHRFGGDDAVAVNRDVAVLADELALLHVETPPAGEPALGEDHAIRATGRDFCLGRDGEGLVLQIGGRGFEQRRKRVQE